MAGSQLQDQTAPRVNGNGHTDDRIDSYPNGHTNGSIPKLHIIIVGAGIGGLSAANFLRQNGHRITLLEQSRFASEVGAAVHLAPNANGLLRRIGMSPEDIGANLFEKVSFQAFF